MAKTKFIRVATSGATTDGRNIEEKWLKDMAETYDPATYQAGISLEHSRYSGNFGHVLALKTEPVTLNVGGKDEQRLGLFAQVDALDPLKELNAKGQKLHASIEVADNFANSGKAYLRNLAVTDNPASLGTEMMKFCAGLGAASPLAARKSEPGNLFTAAEEITLEFAEADTDGDGAVDKLIAMLKTAFGFNASAAADAAAAAAAAKDAAAAAAAKDGGSAFSLAAFAADPAMAPAIKAGIDLATKAFASLDALTNAQAKTDAALAALTAKLDTTPASMFRARTPATGVDTPADARTDC